MSVDIPSLIEDLAKKAKRASLELAASSTSDKNGALQSIARGLESNRKFLLEENQKDIDAAEENGLSEAMVDRLRLTHERIDGMVQGLRQLIGLPDPVGKVIEEKNRPNGLNIRKVRTPIGVIGIIYESRPNVDRLCRTLPKIGQCVDPARRQGSSSFQSCPRLRHRTILDRVSDPQGIGSTRSHCRP